MSSKPNSLDISFCDVVNSIRGDFETNFRNGLLCFLFLFVYRWGHFFYYLHQKSVPPMRWLLAGVLLFSRFLLKLFYFFYGCFIPFSAKIGDRVEFRHGMFGIFISCAAEIGNDVVIFHQVTIGSNTDIDNNPGAPRIGNNVFIGCGAKIIGKIEIKNHVRIGANAIVVDNIPEGSTVVGEKARIIFR